MSHLQYIPSRRRRGQDQDLKRVPGIGDEDFEVLETGLGEDDIPDFLRSKSNLERLENASRFYSQKAVGLIHRLMTSQDANLIDTVTLADVTRLQRQRFYGCLSLPFSLAFFLFFSTSAYLHEDITNVYMIESGLRMALGQNLNEVDTITQLWKWIRYDTLVPELFDQHDHFGDPQKNKVFWSRVLAYNQLQGPLVLQQSRSRRQACKDLPIEAKGAIGDMVCFPKSTVDKNAFGRDTIVTVDTPSHTEYSGGNVTLKQRLNYYNSAFLPVSARRLSDVSSSRRLRTMRTEYMNWLPGLSSRGMTDDEVYEVLVYPNTPRAQIDEHFRYLYERGWFDAQSKALVAKALLLNSEVGRPRLEQYQLMFSFSRGGGIFTRMTMESLFLEFASGWYTLCCDFLWIGCLLFITCVEVKKLFRSIRSGTCRKTHSNFFKILQWMIIVFGWLCILCYVIQHLMRAAVVDALRDVIATQRADIPAEVNNMGQDLLEKADDMLSFTSWFRILLADYHLILMFRFFIAFSAQPRLGVVTSTLEASLLDILHFLVVLLPTFMAYAISGCFIFGRRMEGFSTFDGAIGICFRMASEGEYEWDELSTEDYWTACLWTWTFMLLIVLLMLNMVLAIVLDVYTEMRNSAGQSETVFITLLNLWRRVCMWRCWIPNKDIETKVISMDHRLLSREELLELFPGMCDQQLHTLILACRHQTEVESAKDNALKESMKMTMAIKLAIDRINEEISQISETKLEEIHSTFQVSTESRGWLQETSEVMAGQNHWLLSLQWQLQQLQWQWRAVEALHGSNVRFDALRPPSQYENTEKDIVL